MTMRAVKSKGRQSGVARPCFTPAPNSLFQ